MDVVNIVNFISELRRFSADTDSGFIRSLVLVFCNC